MNAAPNARPNSDFVRPRPHRPEGTSASHDAHHPPPARAAHDETTQRISHALIAALDSAPNAGDSAGDNSGDTDSATRLEGPKPQAVSVWTTAQSSPAAQRKNIYTAESTAHPAKMLPEVV